jgi:hypothetical protein
MIIDKKHKLFNAIHKGKYFVVRTVLGSIIMWEDYYNNKTFEMYKTGDNIHTLKRDMDYKKRILMAFNKGLELKCYDSLAMAASCCGM